MGGRAKSEMSQTRQLPDSRSKRLAQGDECPNISYSKSLVEYFSPKKYIYLQWLMELTDR
jgi:hypothetical protein